MSWMAWSESVIISDLCGSGELVRVGRKYMSTARRSTRHHEDQRPGTGADCRTFGDAECSAACLSSGHDSVPDAVTPVSPLLVQAGHIVNDVDTPSTEQSIRTRTAGDYGYEYGVTYPWLYFLRRVAPDQAGTPDKQS